MNVSRRIADTIGAHTDHFGAKSGALSNELRGGLTVEEIETAQLFDFGIDQSRGRELK